MNVTETIQQYLQKNVPPPNVQLNGTALTSEKIKKYAYGYTAFLQLGLNVAKNELGEIKYHIQDGRMITMRASDYTFLKCNILGIVRKLNGDGNEDLNFFEIEIPKYIRWYLWEEATQAESRKFFENIALKGLIFLKEISYKDNAAVQERISYWIKLIEIAISLPISKSNFEKGLREFLSSHSILNDRIIETISCLNETDTVFGEKIKKLIKNDDLIRINGIFEQAYLKKLDNLLLIENEIQNSYTRYFIEVRAATRQTVTMSERYCIRSDYTQIALSQNTGEVDPTQNSVERDPAQDTNEGDPAGDVSEEGPVAGEEGNPEIKPDLKAQAEPSNPTSNPEVMPNNKIPANSKEINTPSKKTSMTGNGRNNAKNNSKKNSLDIKKSGPSVKSPEGKQDTQ